MKLLISHLLLMGICMFVVQNQTYKSEVSYDLLAKSRPDKGARAFKKRISFPILRYGLVLQRAPSIFHPTFSKMQNQKREKRVPKQVLQELTAQLQFLFPNAERLKVRPFYNQGKLKAYATLGIRRIHVLGTPHNIVQRFHQQHAEKLLSAFPQFSNPQQLAS